MQRLHIPYHGLCNADSHRSDPGCSEDPENHALRHTTLGDTPLCIVRGQSSYKQSPKFRFKVTKRRRKVTLGVDAKVAKKKPKSNSHATVCLVSVTF